MRLHLLYAGHPIANDPLYRLGGEGGEDGEGGEAGEGGARKRPRLCSGEGGVAFSERSRSSRARFSDGHEGEAEGEDAMWLHAWSYSCASEGRPFSVTAPPPAWAAPFGALPPPAALSEAAVLLSSEEGRRLLLECAPADRAAFDLLWPHFRCQAGPTMCGAASVAMLLRAAASHAAHSSLRAAAAAVQAAAASGEGGEGECGEGGCDLDEEVVLRAHGALSPPAAAIPLAKVRSGGITLPELGRLLHSLGLAAAAAPAGVVPASPPAPVAKPSGKGESGKGESPPLSAGAHGTWHAAPVMRGGGEGGGGGGEGGVGGGGEGGGGAWAALKAERGAGLEQLLAELRAAPRRLVVANFHQVRSRDPDLSATPCISQAASPLPSPPGCPWPPAVRRPLLAARRLPRPV